MSEDLLVRHTLFSSDCLVGREKAVSEVCWGDDNRRLKGRSGLVGGGTVCCGSVRCGHDRCGPVVRNDFVVDCDFGRGTTPNSEFVANRNSEFFQVSWKFQSITQVSWVIFQVSWKIFRDTWEKSRFPGFRLRRNSEFFCGPNRRNSEFSPKLGIFAETRNFRRNSEFSRNFRGKKPGNLGKKVTLNRRNVARAEVRHEAKKRHRSTSVRAQSPSPVEPQTQDVSSMTLIARVKSRSRAPATGPVLQ